VDDRSDSTGIVKPPLDAAFIDALAVDATLALPAHSGNGGEVKHMTNS
jgi:hypothetical protein